MNDVSFSRRVSDFETLLLENVSDGVIVTELDGRITEINTAAEKMFGYAEEEVFGSSLTMLLHPVGVNSPTENIVELLGSDQRWTGQSIFVRSDAAEGLCETVLAPFKDREGNHVASIVFIRDITKKRQTEQTLLLARDEAEQSSRGKSEGLARISHEFRTPLNAIIGFSEVIKNQLLGPVGTPTYLGYAHDIHESGLYLLDLVNDLLDLSKIEAGQYELKYEALVVSEFAKDAVHLIEQDVSRKRLILSAEIEDGLPQLQADHRALKQMLLNLLSNAIKFTPECGRITVKANSRSGGVAISVEDSGIGIKPDQLEKVLRPFGQIENAMTTDQKGTGLGLSIVKSLIELQGGRMDLESSPGIGTTVTLYYPPQRVITSDSGIAAS